MTLFRLYNWSAGETIDGGFSHRRRHRKLTGGFEADRFLQSMAAKLPLPSCPTISKHLSAEHTISRFNGAVCLRRAAHSLGRIMHFQLSFTHIVQPYSFRNFKSSRVVFPEIAVSSLPKKECYLPNYSRKERMSTSFHKVDIIF
ncbi:uncharacterized protein LOC129877666 isoform X2 [Solanum dulcamara]|uniref:uncharacterized protein LOC129877666 isoform X2 n=1 Tax=Solanum dulcamara TaxID=45834 RepID=UPI0024855A45|nr:uncharacterized protein LOC129877666 isoform X2 [Solanum dulcamara]